MVGQLRAPTRQNVVNLRSLRNVTMTYRIRQLLLILSRTWFCTDINLLKCHTTILATYLARYPTVFYSSVVLHWFPHLY